MPWSAFLMPAPPPLTITQTPERTTVIVRDLGSPDPVTVTADFAHFDVETRTWRFERGVVATFGPTRLTTNSLTIALGERKQLRAVGRVEVTDPDGNIQASDLDFEWQDNIRKGHATMAKVMVGGVHLSADSIDMAPKLWTLINVEGSTCKEHPELYSLRARRLTVVPESYAKAESASFFLFGAKVLTLPSRTFNLDDRTAGSTIPSLGYRKGVGYGVDWTYGNLLNHNTNFTTQLSTYPTLRPGLSFSVTRSLLSDEDTHGILQPQSDLRERFGYAYSESVENRSPTSDTDFLRTKRRSITVGASLNETAIASLNNTAFTKFGDFAYEVGGPVGSGGYLLTSRMQLIREEDSASQTRGIVRGAYSPGLMRISKSLAVGTRFEVGSFLGKTNYGWTIGNLTLIWSASGNLTFMVNGFSSREFGSPQFDYDQLVAKHGFDLRMDFHFGGTSISLLDKWDRDQHWFDREFRVAQVAGCIEPYVAYRRFPGDYRFGFRLRLDALTDIMRNRDKYRSSRVITIDSEKGR